MMLLWAFLGRRGLFLVKVKEIVDVDFDFVVFGLFGGFTLVGF